MYFFSGQSAPAALRATLLGTVFCATPAFAASTIDTELAGRFDFRAPQYHACLDQTECTVDGITIRAETREVEEGSPWTDGKIYWDPIDGFGVQHGAQNDEIDFNERIRIIFAEPVSVSKVWVSDLFTQEDRRYGSSSTDLVEDVPEDSESAAVTMSLDGTPQANLLISGDERLPWASFNQEVSVRFRENGDMQRRVVINGDRITFVVPGDDVTRPNRPKQFVLESVDPEKNVIFEGVETVEIDLTDILAEFNGTALFVSGETNFEFIRALTETPGDFERLNKVAREKRATINMSNGEVGWPLDTPVETDEIVFFAPFDASNEFSISGLVIEQ